MFDVGSVSRREAVRQVLGRIALRRKPVVVDSSHVQVKLAQGVGHPAPVFGIGISSGMAARGDSPREALTCCSVCLPRKILSTGSFMICERDRHYEGCVS